MAKKFQYSVLSLLAAATMGMTAVAVADDDATARIRPVGQVNVADAAAASASTPAAVAPVAAAAPAAAPADPGAALYQAKGCGACHGADGKTTI
ncbi:MAG TPA: cytochrome c4, partial [Thiolapillus brandeum]|nr:cytochrome c4 [Thiolapillus brandeum]